MKESAEIRIANMAAQIKTSFTPGEIARLILYIQPVPETRLMTLVEFDDMMSAIDASKEKRRFAEKSVEAARRVLVMGASKTEAARDLGLTKQAVGQVVKRIQQKVGHQPQGWTIVNEYLPAHLSGTVKEIGRVLRRTSAAPMNGYIRDLLDQEKAAVEQLLLSALEAIRADESPDRNA